jgi:hypothetical protein
MIDQLRSYEIFEHNNAHFTIALCVRACGRLR